MPGGRPSEYTPERGEAICDLIATSEVGISKLHEQHPDVVPAEATVYRWRDEYPEFRERLARAREAQMTYLVWQADEDIGSVDVEGLGKQANAAVSQARERAAHRRWMAERVASGAWGSRQSVELTGANRGPVKVEDAGVDDIDSLAEVLEGLEELGAFDEPRAEGSTNGSGKATRH